MDINNLITEMYDLLKKGEFDTAFEKYYHDDVIMIEGDGKRRIGKTLNKKIEQEFVNSIGTFNELGVSAITVNQALNVTMVETWLDITYKNGEHLKIEQIARQTWKEGKIIEERFYYNQ